MAKKQQVLVFLNGILEFVISVKNDPAIRSVYQLCIHFKPFVFVFVLHMHMLLEPWSVCRGLTSYCTKTKVYDFIQ